MNYLLVFKTDGKNYLVMKKSKEHNGAFALSAYESKEQLMDDFKAFTDGWTSGTERSASCTLGMANINPSAIVAPENVEDLKKYIIEMKTYHVSGGLGAIIGGFDGMPVTDEIFELEDFRVWPESMKLAGLTK